MDLNSYLNIYKISSKYVSRVPRYKPIKWSDRHTNTLIHTNTHFHTQTHTHTYTHTHTHTIYAHTYKEAERHSAQ